MWQKHFQLSVPEVSWQQEGSAAAEVELTGCSLRGLVKLMLSQWLSGKQRAGALPVQTLPAQEIIFPSFCKIPEVL